MSRSIARFILFEISNVALAKHVKMRNLRAFVPRAESSGGAFARGVFACCINNFLAAAHRVTVMVKCAVVVQQILLVVVLKTMFSGLHVELLAPNVASANVPPKVNGA